MLPNWTYTEFDRTHYATVDPTGGIPCVYVYKIDAQVLYVGTTITGVLKRYQQHLCTGKLDAYLDRFALDRSQITIDIYRQSNKLAMLHWETILINVFTPPLNKAKKL